MRAKVFILGILFAVFCFYSLSYSQVPQMINYQGKLTTPQGALINGSYTMTFTIYDTLTGGTALWTETQTGVSVFNGIFSVLLGSVTPIPFDVFNGSIRYLGVKIGTDPEMMPRKDMVSVPYAYRVLNGDLDWDYTSNPPNMFSLPTGNVGIGTTTPTEKLDVNGNIHASGPIRSGNSITIDGINDNILTSSGKIGFGKNPGLFDDIKIGIGTTAPLYPLHVIGNVDGTDDGVVHITNQSQINATGLYAESWTYGIKGIALDPNGSGVLGFCAGPTGSGAAIGGLHNSVNGQAVFAHNFNSNGFAFYAQGGKNYFENNVGIGTTSPVAKLDVVGWGRIQSGGDAQLTIQAGGVGNATLQLNPASSTKNWEIIAREDLDRLQFWPGDIYFTRGGNVGIGTSNPQGALDVSSTTGALIVPRMTTVQRNAITAVNGMIIYNTDAAAGGQFEFREKGAWVTK